MVTVCEEVLERASLSGVEDAEVAAHAQGCAACREKLPALQLLASTRSEPSDRVLVGFAARTRAKLAKQEAGARFLSPLRAAVMAGAVAAAGASGVLFGVDTLRPTPVSGAGPAVAAVAPAPSMPSDEEAEELFRLELLADPVDPFDSFYADELYARGFDVYDEEFEELFDVDEG